ncbi:MAG TPA: hypothetical protein VEC36_05540 [Patescibacteria group bacterium]|nr:hypothetical protein [Patescibacteria group bacterium]
MKTLAIAALALGMTASAFAQERTEDMQFFNPNSKQAINRFETTKKDVSPFNGLDIKIGGAFTQQFQALEHSNTTNDTAAAKRLKELGWGFNNASANLNFDVQLADGIRLNLVTYLSSRHHNEAWVKGGFIQVDKLTMLGLPVVDNIMKYTTIKVGHMEINYGDAHFRRSDGGNTLFNPFMENYIMDAFTTEIGSEVYFQHSGVLAMVGATGGEIKGDVTNPGKRNPALLAKLGYDSEVMDNLRLRLTGSMYTTDGSMANTLYAGDRTGSNYFWVMENGLPTTSTTANFTSGRFNPGFREKVTAFVVNPFVKFHGLELFGNFEQATGRSATDLAGEERTWTQIGADAIFRFGATENFFVAGRYNIVGGELARATAAQALTKVSINRIVGSAGWFVTDNILAKVEYVQQKYNDFPGAHILNGGEFKGFMISGAVNF